MMTKMSTEEIKNNTAQEVEKDKKPKKKNFGAKKSRIKELLAEIEEKENECQEAKDKYVRLYAEFDNYKKRTNKERLELISMASRDTIVSLLPVLDDFDRAKKSAEDEQSNEEFSEGVALVYHKLYNTLKMRGLQAMESTGEVFDPELHEALVELPSPTEEQKGKVIDTIEKGYLLNDKIIRHAKVVVGK